MASPSPRFRTTPADPREPKIVLGSSSKWRKQILTDMGYSFITMNPDIDERAITDPDPKNLALRIARAKAEALVAKVTEPAILITSDQVIVCDKEVRNKPQNEEECRRFLRSYGSHPAECINAVVVTNTATGKTFEGVDIAKQYFKELPEDFITKLITQGDVMYCAGGFAIELMEPYLERREGEAESVIGLPPSLTHQLIVDALGF